MYKSLYSQVYTDENVNTGNFKVKDVYVKGGRAYHYDIINENGVLNLDLGKGGKFPLPGILMLELHPEKDTDYNGTTKAAEHYFFKQAAQPPALPVIAEPEPLKQGSAAEVAAVPVAEPVALAPLPVAPCRMKYAELVHNRRRSDKRPCSYKQRRYIYYLSKIDIKRYVARCRLDTARASLLISGLLKRAA